MRQREKFSIRKFTFGAASVMIGFCAYGMLNADVYAQETMDEEATTQTSGIMRQEDVDVSTYTFYDTDNQSVLSSQQVKQSDTLVSPQNPEKSGSTFTGWSSSINGSVELQPFDSMVMEQPQVRGAILNYYPIFKENAVVTFVSSNDVVVATKEGVTGDVISTSDVLFDVGVDRKITGWYTTPDYTTQVDYVTLQGNNITLYAKVEQGHFITFDRESSSTYIEPQFVVSGQSSVRPNDPSRSGYSFIGWTTTKGSVKPDYSFGQVVDKNITLYPIWQAEDTTYTVRVWQQNATNAASYVFMGAETFLAKTGSTIHGVDVKNDLTYPYFHRNTTKDQDIVINGDGTSILDIYFDRDIATIEYFYFTDESTGEQYGGISAKYSKDSLNKLKLLTQDQDGNWYLDGNLYTSQRYKKMELRGMYGSTVADNGYTLPTLGENNQIRTNTIDVDASRFFTSGVEYNGNSYRAIEYIPNPPFHRYVTKYELFDGTYEEELMIRANSSVYLSKDKVIGYSALYYQYDDEPMVEITSWPIDLTFVSNKTLYVYRMLNTYTLSFYNNGDISKQEALKYTSPTQAAFQYVPDVPSNLPSNYVFEGWYLDEGLTIQASHLETMPASDVMLYAKWVKPTYTVTVHHSMALDSETSSFKQPYLSTLDTTALYDIVTSGKWATYENGSYHIFSLDRLVDKDLELYPYSMDVQTFTLSYDLNGGSGSVKDDFSYISNTLAIVQSGAGIQKEGRPFLYWTLDGDVYYPGMHVNVTKDATLVAVYGDKVPVANLTYVANGGQGNDVFIGNVENNGILVVRSAVELGIVRPGYRFVGWSDSSDGQGRIFLVGDVIRIDDHEGNVLYAIWEKETEKITSDVEPTTIQRDRQVEPTTIERDYQTSLKEDSSMYLSTLTITSIGALLVYKKQRGEE